MTEADAALLGLALTAPYDSLKAFTGRFPLHSGLFTFLTHAFAHEADIPWEMTRCMTGTVICYSLVPAQGSQLPRKHPSVLCSMVLAASEPCDAQSFHPQA